MKAGEGKFEFLRKTSERSEDRNRPNVVREMEPNERSERG
jgi:hypothetical protein